MRDFRLMDEKELIAVKGFAEALAERARFASNDAQNDFSEPDDANDAEREKWISESKSAAQAYADAQRQGKRTRTYAQDTEPQREGVNSALSWLERRRKSKVRK